MKKLNIAVIGTGRLGGFHAEKVIGLPHVELVGVVDPLPAARDRLAAECNTRAFAEHAPLLGQVDAAIIASPTRFHHRLALDFLSAGAHVLVEKPLASTLAEADELVATAQRQGLVLQVGHVERFNPAFTHALPHTSGPRLIEAARTAPFTFRSTDIGVVLDLMIHDIDLVLAMVGSAPVKVDATGFSVLGGHEDVAHARLEFAAGCVAVLSASRVSYEATRHVQVWAAQAFAAIDLATRTTTLVRPSETLLAGEFHVDELTPEQVDYFRQHLSEEHLPRTYKQFPAVDALSLEQHDFVNAIRAPRQPLVSGAAGRDAVAVAEQILACIHGASQQAAVPAETIELVRPSFVPTPHFHLSTLARRQAG